MTHLPPLCGPVTGLNDFSLMRGVSVGSLGPPFSWRLRFRGRAFLNVRSLNSVGFLLRVLS